jgi:hypothetical protein
MPLVDLSHEERDIVGQALRALAYGSYPPDGEFHTLTGLTRQEAADVADRWPDVDEAVQLDRQAIHCALSLVPLTARWDAVSRFLAVSREEIRHVERKWRREIKRTYLDHLRTLVTPPSP